MELSLAVQYPEGVIVEEKSRATSENRPPDDNRPLADMATIHDDDERLLARIGYRQVRVLFSQYTTAY
jgi:hypothetical protein